MWSIVGVGPIITPMPAPVCWWREHGLWYQCLAPDMTTMKGRSLHMLLQSSVGWRDVLNRALLCKELLSRLVDVLALIVRSYRSITNLSMTCIVSSWRLVGAFARLSRASVSSGSEFHVAQADFFPCPTKADTVSHPVMA